MKKNTIIACFLAVFILSIPTVSNALVIDIGVVGGVDYFYDVTNDRTWVDHTFAVNLTSEAAESAVNSLGLSYATQAQMTDLISSIGSTGTALFNDIKSITNTLSSSTIVGWMAPNFSQPYGSYQFYGNGLYQPVGSSSNAPLTFLNQSVWASMAGDIRNSAPVPEPATMLLLGSGLIGLAGARRKVKK